MSSDTFCPLPWVHLFVDEKGGLFPCCVSHEHSLRSPVTDQPVEILSENAIEIARNSPEMKAIRQAMIRGERPNACATCWRQEALGMKSYRKQVLEIYPGLFPVVAKSSPAETEPLALRWLDLRLGNKCNLRCRMCGPWSSRLTSREYSTLFVKPVEHYSASGYAWYQAASAMKSLLHYSDSLERVHLAGGEPLIVPESFEFLRQLAKTGRARDIALTYNTNLTFIPDDAFDVWRQFKSVSLVASIDAYGELNEYIRFPSKWQEIQRNLRTVASQSGSIPGLRISVHATVQIYNVLRLTHLFEYLPTVPGMDPYPRLDFVVGAPYFDIRILPASLKQMARERIETHVKAHPELPGDFLANLRGLLVFLDSDPPRTLFRPLSEFVRITRFLDRSRGQNVLQILPELRPLMESPLLRLEAQARKMVKLTRKMLIECPRV